MTGTPPVPADNLSPYPLREQPHGGDGPKGPVIRTPQPARAAPSGAALAFFGVALLAGSAAIALALSSRYGDD